MNILSVVISLSLMIFLGQQAVTLHRLTVCRQDAWRTSVTLQTRTLLSMVSTSEKNVLPRCRILVSRTNNIVSWYRLTSPGKHTLSLNLKGKL